MTRAENTRIKADKKTASCFFSGKEKKNNIPVFFQPKLTTGPTDDVYERQADAVADKVMRMSAPVLQRKCTECEEEEKLQRKRKVQTKSTDSPGESSANPLFETTEAKYKQFGPGVMTSVQEAASEPMVMGDWKAWIGNGEVVNNSSRDVTVWSSDNGTYTIPAHSRSQSWGEDVDHVRDIHGQWWKIGWNTAVVDSDGEVSGVKCRSPGRGQDCGWGMGDYPAPTYAKLKVNQPNDPFEQEADAVAEKVVNGEASIQRKCAACEEEKLQRQPEEEEEKLQGKSLVQLKTTSLDRGKSTSPWVAREINSSRGNGQPLPKHTRSLMENGIGANFRNVKVHIDDNAVQMNRELGARAFTVGNDIYFNSEEYRPEATEGKRLLAHELTHVIQQGRAQVSSKNVQRAVDEDEITEDPIRYSFSTSCGWIDWSHASPGRTSRLIEAVKDASDRMRASGSTSPQSVTTPAMESSAGPLVLSSVTPTFNIKRPLSHDEVLSVALRVFMLQSLAFENLQQWTDTLGESSFSAEDLPSNIIAFYMAARNFNRSAIETICDVWDPESSLTEFLTNPPTERNRTFRPLPSSHTTGGWPTDLSSVQPAAIDGPLMDSPTGSIETSLSSARNINLAEYNALLSHRFSVVSVSGSNTIDISSEESSSAAGNHFEIAGLPSSHNFVFRWNILDNSNRAYRMWSDSGQVHQYGDAHNAYIGSGTRALLRRRNITSIRGNCRIAIRNETQFNEVFRLRVNLTW